MARIWYDAGGAILRVAANDAEEARHVAPAGAAGSVAFDEQTNASVLAELASAWQAHTCPAGVLKRDGVTVSIAADGQTKTDRSNWDQQYAAFVAACNTYLGLASPTNAQVVAQVRLMTQAWLRVAPLVNQFRQSQE